MTRHCVICGAPFRAAPSDKAVTCSPACRSERARRAASGSYKSMGERAAISEAARAQQSQRLPHLRRGTAAARARNEADPASNHEARVWALTTPEGENMEICNLRRWLIRRLGEAEGVRVFVLLRRMAAVMREGGEAWVTRCGWSLREAPRDKWDDA